MIKAKVIKTFTCKGKTYTPGMIVRFPASDIDKLDGFVRHLQNQSLTKYETSLMQRSTAWLEFCDHCERQVHGGLCHHKRTERYDPFKGCIGWQLKNGRNILH